MIQRTKQTLIIEFEILLNMDDDSTQQDVINENKYVIAELINSINPTGFIAGCGLIENVNVKQPY